MSGHYFQPYSEALAADPYPVYAQLRERDPVLRDDVLGLTLFSRYADVQTLLRDPRLGRAPPGRQPTMPRRQMPHYRRYVSRNLLEREGESHSRLRCLFARLLTPQRIAAMRGGLEHRCVKLVASVAAHDSFDLLEDIAVPLTVDAIADLMGWPENDRHRLRPWSASIVRLYEADATADDEQAAESAVDEFASAIAELLRRRQSKPRDDLVSLLGQFERAGELDRDELVSSCMLLLNAGHEATVNACGNGVLALLRHTGQLQRLRDACLQQAAHGLQPDQAAPAPGNPLLASAIEEMLRYDPPLHLFHRFVIEDLQIHGVALKRGDKVGLLYGSANRDADAFPDPDRFDIARRPNRHFSFGAGNHFCMGAPLARLELAVLVHTLLTRLPQLRLADAQVRYRGGFVFRGLQRLRLAA